MYSIAKAARSLPLIVGIVWLIGCTKIDEYKKYIDGKSTRYPAKIDSLVVFSGHERVVISSAPILDPTVTQVTIYWNNRRDSVVVDVANENGVRRLNQSLGLQEGLYYFDLFTYDGMGNRSVPVSSLGVSYGSLYEQSLIPRSVHQAELIEEGLLLYWSQPIHASRGVRLVHNGRDGDSYTRWISNDADTTLLTNYFDGIDIGIQTWFMPDTISIDTFYTPLQVVDLGLLLPDNGQH